MSASPSFVDLFSGCGGLSFGLTQASWSCVAALDNWSDAVETYNANFEGHVATKTDVRDLDAKALAALLSVRPTWVVGGAPCQGFSTVGKRQRDDPRNALVREFRRVVSLLRPEGFCLENVVGLKDMDFEAPVRELLSEAGGGYAVTSIVVRAADFGVPQLRKRIVFVGHRERGYFNRPAPTVRPTQYTTVWDAIGDLPPLRPGESKVDYEDGPFADYQREMRRGSSELQGHAASRHPDHLVKAISFIPDGGNRRSIPPKYQPRSGFHNSYSRLASNAPAVAVTSNMGKPSATRCIHPFQHRGLTAREGARLQSFRDSFHFRGGNISQRLQIANAVPPLLAATLARALEDDGSWTDTNPHFEPLQLAVA